MANRSTPVDGALLDYLVAHSAREHPAQAALREATRTRVHAGMQIGPEQAQFFALLVRLTGAGRAIEVGVFTGYGALAVALALPADGTLLACDISDAYTRVGRPASDADTKALQALNDKIHADQRIDMAMLPLGDGVTLARKR